MRVFMAIPGETERLIAHIDANDCVCPSCGYSLDGLRSPMCPECGRGLSVRLLTRRGDTRAAHIAGSAGLVISFVMHGSTLCVLLLLTTAEAGYITTLVDVGIGAVIFGVCMYLTFWWDRERDRLAMRTPRRRWVSAIAMTSSPIWTWLPWIVFT